MALLFHLVSETILDQPRESPDGSGRLASSSREHCFDITLSIGRIPSLWACLCRGYGSHISSFMLTPQPCDFQVLLNCLDSRFSAGSQEKGWTGCPPPAVPRGCVCSWAVSSGWEEAVRGLRPPHRPSIFFSILFCYKRHGLGCKICEHFALNTSLRPAHCGSSIAFMRLSQSKFQGKSQGFERLIACPFSKDSNLARLGWA